MCTSGNGELTARERVLRARIGAYALHAKHDPKETTLKAREAFLSKFLTQVDPDGALSAEERERRALAARKAYFARLAFESAKARHQRGGRGDDRS